MAKSDTSMALTGTYSGLHMNLYGNAGTIAVNAGATARIGYQITTNQTGEGVVYSIVSVASETEVTDPPTLIVSSYYTQSAEYDEVDLDVKFTDIPNGTLLQVYCSTPSFNISKQPISGSGLIGSQGMNLGSFNTSIDIRLWVNNPNSIVKSSPP